MLKFNETTQNAQVLAIHYATLVDNNLLIQFMKAQAEITSSADALEIARGFWQMVELSIQDNDEGKVIEGIEDIEFWMHKLFNKVYGYFSKNGYSEEWEQANKEANEAE